MVVISRFTYYKLLCMVLLVSIRCNSFGSVYGLGYPLSIPLNFIYSLLIKKTTEELVMLMKFVFHQYMWILFIFYFILNYLKFIH